jgi:hypothetical protein
MERKVAYDHIDGFVHIDNDAVLVNDWNSRYSSFRKHMNNIKNGSIQAGGGDRVVRILTFWNI